MSKIEKEFKRFTRKVQREVDRFAKTYVEPEQTSREQIADSADLAAIAQILLAQPTQPTEPTQPAQSTQPTELTQPALPDHPTQPTQLTQPAQLTQPTELTQPVQLNQPTQLTQATQLIQPISFSEADFIDKNWTELVQRANGVEAILDVLLSKKVINNEQYSDINAESTPQRKMRALITGPIHSSGALGKCVLYDILMKQQPYMMIDLGAV